MFDEDKRAAAHKSALEEEKSLIAVVGPEPQGKEFAKKVYNSVEEAKVAWIGAMQNERQRRKDAAEAERKAKGAAEKKAKEGVPAEDEDPARQD